MIRDDAKFAARAGGAPRHRVHPRAIRIADKAELRQLLGVIAQLDYLEGKYDDAYQVPLKISGFAGKPADRLLSGRSCARKCSREATGGRRRRRFVRDGTRDRGGACVLPYSTIENDVKRSKAQAETLGETLVLGNVRNVLQPTVAKTGTLSSDLVPGVVGAKYVLATALPLKKTLVETYSAYLDAHKVEKADIWGARDASLPPGRGLVPVRIAVWDSGVDTALFPDLLVKDAGGKVAFIGFDRYGDPSPSVLFPLPAEARDRWPQMRSRVKAFPICR